MNNLLTKNLLGTVRSHNLLTILIWTTGIIAMTVWTVIDVQPLLETYLRNNVDNRIAVVRNDSVWPPNLTVCMPYYSDSLSKIGDWLLKGSPPNSCMECEALTERGWDVWSDFNLTRMSTAMAAGLGSALFDAFMRRIVDEQEKTNGLDFLNMNRSDFNWNQPLIDVAFVFLSRMTTTDFYFLLGRAATFDLTVSIETHDEVIRSGIVDDLRDRVLSSVRMYYRRIVLPDLDSAFRYIRGDEPSGAVFPPLERPILTPQGICLRVQDGAIDEYYQYIPIDYEGEIDPPWMRTPRATGFSIWLDDRVMFGAGEAQLSDAIYMTSPSEIGSTYEKIGVDFDVDVRVTETRPYFECIRNETLIHCAVRKGLEEVTMKCGCMPLGQKQIFPDMGRGLPYCSPSIYEKCAPNLKTTLFGHRDACSNQCDFASRKAKCTAVTTHDVNSKSLQFWVEYQHVLFSPYVQVSIVEKLSSEEFISQLGGTIGVFLGFSGLTVVALAVFCIEKVGRSRLCMRRRNRDITVGGSGAAGGRMGHPHRTSSLDDGAGGVVVSKRILLTDIAKLIQDEARVREERMTELMREERRLILEEAAVMIRKEISLARSHLS